MNNKVKWIFLFVLIAVVGLFYFSQFTGFTFVAPNTVSFEINESWNLSNGFLRVSQGNEVFDVNDLFSLVVGNQIVVNLDNFNLTEGEVYVDLAIDEMVVASEMVYYVPPSEEVINGPIDDIVGGGVIENISEEDVEEEIIVVEDIIVEPMSGVVPTQGQSILNATFYTNYTNENLTGYNQSTADGEGDNVKNIYNWYKNGTSLTVLNLPFEGGSANGSIGGLPHAARDYSSYVNNASAHEGSGGTALWCASCGFDGFGAYQISNDNDALLNVSDHDSLNFNMSNTTGFSVELRFKQFDPGHNSYLFSKGETGASDSQYRIMFSTSTGNLVYRVQNTSEVAAFVGSATILDDVWYHVVMVVNQTSINGYVNGASDGGAEHSVEGEVGTSSDLIIGNYFNRNLPINGTIDEFRMWDRPLTEEQIFALYANETNRIVQQETNKNETWNVTVTPNDGSGDGFVNWSNSLTVLNSVPVVSLNYSSNATMNYTNGSLSVNWSFSDEDGDSITMNETKWWNGNVLNTTFANFTTIESANLTDGDVWNVSVRSYDGEGWSNWTANQSITIETTPFLMDFLIPYVKDIDITISLNFTTTKNAHCEYKNGTMDWTAMADTENMTHGQILNLTSYDFFTYYINCNDSSDNYVNDTMSFATVYNIPSNNKGYDKVNFTANESQNFSLHLGNGVYAGNLSLTTKNNISGAYVKFFRVAASSQLESSSTGLPNSVRQKVIAIVDENVINNLSNSTFYIYNLGEFSNVLDGPYVYQFNVSSEEWNKVLNSSTERNATAFNSTNFRTLMVSASVNITAEAAAESEDTPEGGTSEDSEEVEVEEEEEDWFLEEEFDCGEHITAEYDYLYADEMTTIDVYDPCIGLLYVEFTPNVDIDYTFIDFFREDDLDSNQYKGFDMAAQNILDSNIQEMNMVYGIEKDWVDSNFIGDCSLENFGLESESGNRYYGDNLDEDDNYYYFISEGVEETGVFFITAFDCLSSEGIGEEIQETLDNMEEREKRDALEIIQKSLLLVFIVLILGNLGVYYVGKMFLVFGWSGKNYYFIEDKTLLVKDKNVFKLKYYLLYNLYKSQDINKLKVMLMNQGWDINVVENTLVKIKMLPRGKLEMFVYSKMASGMNENELVSLLVSKGWNEQRVRLVINSFKRV
jgi:hypothetical protein